MRKVNSSFLITLVLALCAILFVESCSSINVSEQQLYNNNAIARLYIGLNLNKLQREIEIEEVEDIISLHFSGYTINPSTGSYKGEREKSLIVTIINCCTWEQPKEIFRNKISNLVSHLKGELGQESILVEYLSNGKTEAFEVLE